MPKRAESTASHDAAGQDAVQSVTLEEDAGAVRDREAPAPTEGAPRRHTTVMTAEGLETLAAHKSDSKKSQTISTSTSPSAANTPPADINGDGARSVASAYGTRSRNRTGASRPNYAEDNGDNADFLEVDPAKGTVAPTWTEPEVKVPCIKEPSPQVPVARRPLPTTMADPIIATPKDYIPGTSTFSAVPTTASAAPPSKKRKAAGLSTNGSTTYNAQASGQAKLRQPRGMSTNALGVIDSNMLSFENCGGQPRDGKLVADDGTVLTVNGELLLSILPGII